MFPTEHILIRRQGIKQRYLIKILCSSLVMRISRDVIQLIQSLVHAAIFRTEHRCIIRQFAAAVEYILAKSFCNIKRPFCQFLIIHKRIDINQPGENLMQVIPGHDYVFIARSASIHLI